MKRPSLITKLKGLTMNDAVKKLSPMNDTAKQPSSPTATPAEFDAWVRGLVPHPLADMFPMIEGPTLESLKASIAADGILDPIDIYQNQVLDGRNRRAAGLAVGHHFTPANFKTFTGTAAEAEQYVINKNVRRRQLSDDDKKAFVLLMLAKHPTKGDRQIARLSGVSHSFVGKLRAPAGDSKFDKFAKDWDDLSDQQREKFAAQFATDLRELLA
jgi:hypothetical protein